MDCSTQFFILLQPAPWMAYKYVAFGQLIDGEETLKKIEEVSTWYEAPLSSIIIDDAGVLNMDCHGITINKETNAYIQGHIEDLIALGEVLYEALLENVFLEIEMRCVNSLVQHVEEEAKDEEAEEEEGTSNMRATKRFMRKKEEIEQQIGKSAKDIRGTSAKSVKEIRETSAKSEKGIRESPAKSEKGIRGTSAKSVKEIGGTSVVSAKSENNEFDVDVYVYEPEEYVYPHVSPVPSVSLVVKPEKPYYLALTDVPYPGEVDSTYDLKKYLKGDYCLESDIDKNAPKKGTVLEKIPSDAFDFGDEDTSDDSEDIDTDDELDIRRYLKNNVDRISFSGAVIKNIARQAVTKFKPDEGLKLPELITDEELRRIRLASADYRHQRDKKVSISAPSDKSTHQKIKRRQTGFVHAADMEKLRAFAQRESTMIEEEEDEDNRKVRIDVSTAPPPTAKKSVRRPTAFVRGPDVPRDTDEPVRPSVLARLYDEVTYDDDEQGPTLKDYKPASEMHGKNLLFLTSSPQSRMKNTEHERESFFRYSITMEDRSLDHVLNLQHGKSVTRKISSDYVKTLDHIEHKLENSIRSVEYAKTRPTISVSEYQMKNQQYADQLKLAASKSEVESKTPYKPNTGLRLPGDTPLYSSISNIDICTLKS